MKIYVIQNNDVVLLATSDIETAMLKFEEEIIGTDKFALPCYQVWEDGEKLDSYYYFYEWIGGKFNIPTIDLRTELLIEAQSRSLEDFYAFCTAAGVDLAEEEFYFGGNAQREVLYVAETKDSPTMHDAVSFYEKKLYDRRVERGLPTDGRTISERLRSHVEKETEIRSRTYDDTEVEIIVNELKKLVN